MRFKGKTTLECELVYLEINYKEIEIKISC